MQTISLAVLQDDYEAFREAARQRGTSIAQLIREAMSRYRREELEGRTRMTELPGVFVGVRLREPLPKRWEIWDEIYSERWSRIKPKRRDEEE